MVSYSQPIRYWSRFPLNAQKPNSQNSNVFAILNIDLSIMIFAFAFFSQLKLPCLFGSYISPTFPDSRWIRPTRRVSAVIISVPTPLRWQTCFPANTAYQLLPQFCSPHLGSHRRHGEIHRWSPCPGIQSTGHIQRNFTFAYSVHG